MEGSLLEAECLVEIYLHGLWRVKPNDLGIFTMVFQECTQQEMTGNLGGRVYIPVNSISLFIHHRFLMTIKVLLWNCSILTVIIKIPKIIKLYRKNIDFDSEFWKIQFMIHWLLCFYAGVRHILTGGLTIT